MYKTRRTTVSKDLPYDIVVDILSRLPVKTLMRLRCVCKSWNSIIIHPTFITKHLNRVCSYKNNDAYVQYLNFRSNSRRLVWRLLSEKRYVHRLELEIPFDPLPLLVGAVNGLVCLSTDSYEFGQNICLWNPSIRKHKTVSLSSSIFPFPEHSKDKNYFALGFGFHSQTNDYKIVRILYCYDDDCEYIANSLPPIEVYSLNTDSWTRIEALVPCYGSHRWSDAFFNGSLHWVAYRSVAHPDYSHMIMSFDIGGEVFGEMMLPNFNINGVDEVDLSLSVLKESLSLCACFKENGHCDVWVMREYGVVDSWTKQFTVAMGASIVRSFGFTNNDAPLLVTRSNKLFSYDPENFLVKELRILVARNTSYAFPFMETLVLL